MMAPSVSPSTPGGPNNPGLRLYKFETNTGQVGVGTLASFHNLRTSVKVYLCDVSIERAGNICAPLSRPRHHPPPSHPRNPVLCRIQVLDYTQYYLNLPEANLNGKASWLVEYSMLEYYDLQEITAITLHDLADRFTQSNDYAFVRYV